MERESSYKKVSEKRFCVVKKWFYHY